MTQNNKELDMAIEAAQKAGAVLRENFGRKYRVIRKSPKEMVSRGSCREKIRQQG
jgi:hypothetical protein